MSDANVQVPSISGASYGSGASIAIAGGHWVVNYTGGTEVLTGVNEVTIGSVNYMLVDQFGANGGYQSVQTALDAALGGETILVAPGTYTEGEAAGAAAGTGGGLFIDKQNITLQGVHADGSPITTAAAAAADGATIISANQTDFGSNDFISANAVNTTIQGLRLQAGPATYNKVLEIWGNNATVQNDFIDTNIGGVASGYSGASAIYLNDVNQLNPDGSVTTTNHISTYTISNNILNEGVIVSNGVGDPADKAKELVTGNQFQGTFDPATGNGRYDTVDVQGSVTGVGWLNAAAETPTISGNTFANNSTPFLLRASDNLVANLPDAATVAAMLASNGDANLTYAYALTPGGAIDTATRTYDGVNYFHSFAVTNSIDTLNLALTSTYNTVFYGSQRDYMHAGDTLMVQSGSGAVSSQIMVDDLTVQPSANSANLTLTLATQYADGTTIPGGVTTLTLGDYDRVGHHGANVAVIGNDLGDTITANSGNDTITGGAGNDTFYAGLGTDILNGGGGVNTAVFAATTVALTQNAVGGWTVSAGPLQGADTLSNIDIVRQGSGHSILLVGQGGFATLQEAISAAANGDTIEVASGTYSDFVDVNKQVTIIGANQGVDPNTGTRGPETLLTGGVRTDVAGVTLNGLSIQGSYPSDSIDGTDLPNGLLILGANTTVQNTIFTGDALNSRPFSTEGGATGLAFSHNLVASWNEGAYLTNGTSGSVDHNVFTGDGNGVLTEDSLVTIAFNSFSGSGGPDVVLEPSSDSNIPTYVHDNSYSPGHARPVSVYVLGPSGLTVTGGAVNTTFHLEYHSGSATVNGGAGVSNAISYSDTGAGVVIDFTAHTATMGSSVAAFSNIQNAIGGSGNDTFVAGPGGGETFDGGGGTNTVSFANDTKGVTINLGTGVAQGRAAGTDTFVNIQNAIGGHGNDTFISGAGVSTMTGGGGNETFYVNNSADQVFTRGAGKNTVYASVSFNLGAGQNIANLKGTGSANITLTGNDLVNKIYANAGNDTIIGAGGADALYAGTGTDTFQYNAISDSTLTAHDTITGFKTGTDKIDLGRAYAFNFVGKTFTHHIGDLIIVAKSSSTYLVEGDTTGSGKASFEIVVNTSGSALTSGDLILSPPPAGVAVQHLVAAMASFGATSTASTTALDHPRSEQTFLLSAPRLGALA